MATNLPPNPSDLKSCVFSRIEGEGICPRGRWFFMGKECLIWSTWLLTILVAAVAVAISFFVIMHRQYAFFEATHDSFLALLFDVLPYLWLAVFVAAASFAFYHFRHTRRGYRYSFLSIAGATVLASVMGGLFLHYLGMSFVFDDMLGKYMPGVYASQAMQETRFWQNPSAGRLLATLTSETASGTVLVVDAEGTSWEVNITELFPRDIALLRAGTPVRILGNLPSDGEVTFHACGVFPWLYSKMMTMADFKDDREDAIERLHGHRDRMLARAKVDNQSNEEVLKPVSNTSEEVRMSTSAAALPDLPPPESLCSEIAAVKRLR